MLDKQQHESSTTETKPEQESDLLLLHVHMPTCNGRWQHAAAPATFLRDAATVREGLIVGPLGQSGIPEQFSASSKITSKKRQAKQTRQKHCGKEGKACFRQRPFCRGDVVGHWRHNKTRTFLMSCDYPNAISRFFSLEIMTTTNPFAYFDVNSHTIIKSLQI